VNGPVPDAVVVNVALVPGQLVWSTGPAALVSVFTVSVPLVVTGLPHAPVTCTVYVPALAPLMLFVVKLGPVAPASNPPSFRHT
jgi:hypothetical protein